MRRGSALLLGWALTAIGCFAPFSWPEDRRSAEPAEATLPTDVDAPAPIDALTRAAESLDRGDQAGALPHLQAHLEAHPDAVMIRAHVAELQFRLGHHEESRQQFERFVHDAQAITGPANAHLVHCHTRLMELAREEENTYREELHRGIGLLLLVKRWEADPQRRDEQSTEQTLTKAVAALRACLDDRPEDPRASLYLAEVYLLLDQPELARSRIQVAKAGLPEPTVTPTERERIQVLAIQLKKPTGR